MHNPILSEFQDLIIEKLLKEKAIIKTHDPVAMHETKRRIGDTVAYCKDIYEALIDADALLILTEWSEFRVPNYVVMSKLMKNKVIFDGRNTKITGKDILIRILKIEKGLKILKITTDKGDLSWSY